MNLVHVQQWYYEEFSVCSKTGKAPLVKAFNSNMNRFISGVSLRTLGSLEKPIIGVQSDGSKNRGIPAKL